MNKKFSTKLIVRQGIIAALYAVLTLAFPNLSYGPLQFRASEVLVLLAFFNGEYIWGLTIGCFIANMFSPYISDIIVGTFASFLAAYLMSKLKNIWIASLMPAIANILVGIQIYVISNSKVAFFLTTGQIMLSEIIIVTLIGVPVFKILIRNKQVVNYLKLNKENKIYIKNNG
ncbi:QueT transporter family protein [Peptostreptococcaceae bacterium OttesenSCG-928-C18]|nr:QueT transporter family protein [Peptostreptococcaceae bacterium OttesenSCG-928-C18]